MATVPSPISPRRTPLLSCPLPFRGAPFFLLVFPVFLSFFRSFLSALLLPLHPHHPLSIPLLEARSAASSVKFCIRGSRQKAQGRRIGRLLLSPSTPGNFMRSSAPNANQRARTRLISTCLSKCIYRSHLRLDYQLPIAFSRGNIRVLCAVCTCFYARDALQ